MKKWYLAAAIALFTVMLQSCDSNDDNPDVTVVPEAVQTAFSKTYSVTTGVKWENSKGLLKAEIRQNGVEVDVYYRPDGTWVRTETDYNKPLPEPITAYIGANYAGYRVDDIDYIQTPQGNYFNIELEKKGSPDVELNITESGKVLQSTGPSNTNGGIPQAVLQAFATKYPGITPTWELEGTLYNADFSVNGIETDAYFDASGTWVRSETEYKRALPAAVQTFVTTNYAGYRVDDVDYVETPAANYFKIELEKKGAPDIKIRVSENGTLYQPKG